MRTCEHVNMISHDNPMPNPKPKPNYEKTSSHALTLTLTFLSGHKKVQEDTVFVTLNLLAS